MRQTVRHQTDLLLSSSSTSGLDIELRDFLLLILSFSDFSVPEVI